MLFELCRHNIIHNLNLVLILILMEYALWVPRLAQIQPATYTVLILILMEYALWEIEKIGGSGKNKNDVLILILMEYALWE